MTDEESHYHQLKEIGAISTNLNLTVRCRDTLSTMSEALSDIACRQRLLDNSLPVSGFPSFRKLL